MAIFNKIFKKRKVKETKKAKGAKKAKEVRERKEVEKKPTEKKPQALPRPKRKKRGVAAMVLKTPHITEKAGILADKNQYVFKIFSKANKQEVKKAVEETYDVDVVKMRIIKVRKKPRRLGKTSGWKKGYKKAIITLRQGQKIEILPR